jgi:hypothetical protein
VKVLWWVLAVAVAALIAAPFAAALIVTAVIAPAAAEQPRAHLCANITGADGTWRPPFQQAYVRTSTFGMRFHPIRHVWRLHSGVDLAALPGPGPVVAVAAGTVTAAGVRGSYGNAVDVDHGGGITSRYAHLARINPGISPGAVVTTGQVLGLEGSTGASTGNHLHLEILTNGTAVDPEPFLAQRGAPLDGRAVAPTPTTGTAPVGPPQVAGRTGFDLPPAGTPRLASLTVPAAPIPARVKALYLAAATAYRIPWTLLAGVGMEETAHGRATATSSAGAQGLMQFMPDTFSAYGVDGDHDGTVSITSDADSVFSAANYLTRSGATKGPTGVRTALYAYNHATWYVNDVLHYAHTYGGGTIMGDPTSCPTTGNGDPTPTPPTGSQVGGRTR